MTHTHKGCQNCNRYMTNSNIKLTKKQKHVFVAHVADVGIVHQKGEKKQIGSRT